MSKIDWVLMQIADSCLPVGGFNCSSGLEAAVHSGISPRQYILSSLHNTPNSIFPWLQATRLDIDSLVKLDAQYECVVCGNHVARRASAAQGLGYLSLATRSFHVLESHHLISAFKSKVLKQETFGHFPICFSLVCQALGIDVHRIMYLFLYLHLKGLLSAAVRLSKLGPYESQTIMYDMQHVVETLLDDYLRENHAVHSNSTWKGSYNSRDDTHIVRTREGSESEIERKWAEQDEINGTFPNVFQTSPLIDIIQGSHDRLYTKLFNS